MQTWYNAFEQHKTHQQELIQQAERERLAGALAGRPLSDAAGIGRSILRLGMAAAMLLILQAAFGGG
jgi:hypothetical protein